MVSYCNVYGTAMEINLETMVHVYMYELALFPGHTLETMIEHLGMYECVVQMTTRICTAQCGRIRGIRECTV